MGKRKTSRTKMVLPLRIWGTDAGGRPFVQLAHTLDVGTTGARLAGFRKPVTPGDILGVQYKLHKSQFRVAWVGRPGTSREDQVGIEYLGNDRKIFGLEVPSEPLEDDYVAPRDEELEKHQKQRMHVRYPVNGGAEVWMADGQRGTAGRLVDVSLSGCYMQISSPLPLHVRCRLLLKVGQMESQMHGVVRTCHPNVGMGVEFIRPERSTDDESLRLLIKNLEDGDETGGFSSEPPAPKPDSAYLTQKIEALSADLMAIEALMKSIGPDPLVLRQFRDTLGHVRTTSWAVQKWLELDSRKEDMFPVLTYLNDERIRVATQLCRSLSKDMQAMDLKLGKSNLEELLGAVEDLFSHLAGFNLMEIEPPTPVASPAAETLNPPVSAPVAAADPEPEQTPEERFSAEGVREKPSRQKRREKRRARGQQ